MNDAVMNGLWTSIHPAVELTQIPIGKNESALYFLHGVCGVFALAIHDRFGYHIEVAAEENIDGTSWGNRVIHIYCRDSNDNLIDVRGITNNEELFMECFEDFFVPKYGDFFELSADELRKFLTACMSKEELDWLYHAAMRLIEENTNWYKYP